MLLHNDDSMNIVSFVIPKITNNKKAIENKTNLANLLPIQRNINALHNYIFLFTLNI